MQRILTIGSAVQDLYFHDFASEELIRHGAIRPTITLTEGAKIAAKTLHIAPGGGALNSAHTFRAYGFEVTPHAMIGDDSAGAWLLEHLKRHTIATHALQIKKQATTGVSAIITEPPGDSTIISYRGASAQLAIKPELIKQAEPCAALYITALTNPAAQQITQYITTRVEPKPFIACNPGEFQVTKGAASLEALLPHINLLILNAHEARQFARYSGMLATITKLSKQPIAPKTPPLMKQFMQHNGISLPLSVYVEHVQRYNQNIMVIVTDGRRGIYCIHQKEALFLAASPINLRHSVGAGDAFGSTVTACLLRKMPLHAALMAGQLQSETVLMGPDSTSTIRLITEDDVARRPAPLKLKI